MAAGPSYMASARTVQKTPLQTFTPLLRVTQPLPSSDCFSGSTILALSKYATIFTSDISTSQFIREADLEGTV
jgi:hypothetical protein